MSLSDLAGTLFGLAPLLLFALFVIAAPAVAWVNDGWRAGTATFGLLAVASGLVVGAVILWGGPSSSVYRYCHYGAVSEAQLDGCIDHVSSEVVDDRTTNAAKFSRGEIDGCYRADAGPFCLIATDEAGYTTEPDAPSSSSGGWGQPTTGDETPGW